MLFKFTVDKGRLRPVLPPRCRCPLCTAERLGSLGYLRDNLRGWLRTNDGDDLVEAQRILMNLFREAGDEAFDIIAHMIDPAGKSYWRLELKRRRGSMRKMATSEQQYIARMYQSALSALKNAERASPVKTARGAMAQIFNMTDEKFRALIERTQGKRQRRPGGKRGKS